MMTKNIALFKEMIDRYNYFSFTHDYIFGVTVGDNVYMAITDSSILPYILKLDKASRGAGYALRFKPTKEQKNLLIAKSESIVLCSKEYFENECANSKYNKGEIFEKMVTEYFGQHWEKDNLPFNMGGDLTANGIDYQIKFDKATFTNEKSLARLMGK